VRKNPVEVFPIVKPVECSFRYDVPDATRRPSTFGDIRRTLIWSDPHFAFYRDDFGNLIPLHNRQVLDIVGQIFADSGASRMDCLGDVFDAPDMTDRYIRTPEYEGLFQPAIVEAYYWMSYYRSINPDAEIYVHQGNHDLRMTTAIITHLKAAYQIRAATEMALPPALSVPRLIALHDLGIVWVDGYPVDVSWLNDGVELKHGDIARQPGHTARAMVDVADTTIITGHVHRTEMAVKALRRADTIRHVRGICVGCTCHIDGRVPSRNKGKEQWDNSILIVDYDPDSSYYSVDVILIEDGVAVWNGNVYMAAEYPVTWEPV
jgi:hypothetical protein